MEDEEELEISRQARAIEVLERLGSNEDRNRGAQAREALNGFVRQKIQQGKQFSSDFISGAGRALGIAAEGFGNAVAPVINAAGEIASDVGDFVAPAVDFADRTIMQEVENTASTIDTIRGFINPESAREPEVQAQLDQISAADPLATNVPGAEPSNSLAGSSLQSIQNFGTPVTETQVVPQGSGAPVPGQILGQPGVPTADNSNVVGLLDQLTQQQLAVGNQINAARLAEINNAVQVDDLNRAQAASQLVTAPQLQFSAAQQLGNANLAASGVQPSISASVGALQQLSPSANIQSVQPAINANASQQRSVNSSNQAATRANTRALEDAQKLAALKRQAFIDNVVVPGLSGPRN